MNFDDFNDAVTSVVERLGGQVLVAYTRDKDVPPGEKINARCSVSAAFRCEKGDPGVFYFEFRQTVKGHGVCGLEFKGTYLHEIQPTIKRAVLLAMEIMVNHELQKADERRQERRRLAEKAAKKEGN